MSNAKPRGFFDGRKQEPSASALHIRDEIDGMEAALRGVTLDTYRKNYTLRPAAERAVQIVSEAAKALPPEILARHSEAPWSAIIGIGNILRHEYQHVDDRRLWEIVSVYLPQLRPVIATMIAEFTRE